jgi:hypothetical protein
MADLLRQAPFVLRARVREVTEPGTAIVQVLEVIRAPEPFARLAGHPVTVRLATPGTFAVGQLAVFFARAVSISHILVVQEVGHRIVATATQAVPGLQDALALHATEPLRGRLQRAVAVVAGQVSTVRPSTMMAAGATPVLSRHDPQWSAAVVDVRRTIMGSVPGNPVTILFAASIDARWYRAPKYHPGQQGVWLLQQELVPAHAAAALGPTYTTLNPNDYQPPTAEARVRALIERHQF